MTTLQPSSTNLPRPIPESYWVVPGKLLAGEYPGTRDNNAERARQRLDRFLEAGFDTFIDLTMPGELPPYAAILHEQAQAYARPVNHQRFGIGDMGLPTQPQMKHILDALEAATNNGNKVYVHCMAGIGRTGTTVGCYLVRTGLENKAALAQLASWWHTVPKSAYNPFSPETPEQTRFVLNWPQGG